jgi:hypothetical protein
MSKSKITMSQIGPQKYQGSPPGWKGPHVNKDAITSTPVDINAFNAEPSTSAKVAQARATPGMTYRVNEDRYPANPFPGNNVSTPTEVGDVNVADKQPLQIYSAGYMRMAMIGLGLLGVALIVLR